MTKKEYKSFIKKSIKRYATEEIKSGYWTKDEALKESKAMYKRNLGKGFSQSKFDFYKIKNDKSKKVGYLWLMKKPKALFIAEIYIRKKHRHQGYGKALLKKVDKIAKRLKLDKIELSVLGHNQIAQSFYTQSGYRVNSEFRVKRI